MHTVTECGAANGRWEKVRRARRKEIVSAVAGIFSEHGFESASMGMLAEAANVTKATIYAHFRDKNRLFEAVMGSWLDDLPPLNALLSGLLPGQFALRAQLSAIEGDLHSRASVSLVRTMARSSFIPEKSMERWDQRYAGYVEMLIGAFSQKARCPEPMKAAHQFLSLVIYTASAPGAFNAKDPSPALNIVDLFVRAYDDA